MNFFTHIHFILCTWILIFLKLDSLILIFRFSWNMTVWIFYLKKASMEPGHQNSLLEQADKINYSYHWGWTHHRAYRQNTTRIPSCATRPNTHLRHGEFKKKWSSDMWYRIFIKTLPCHLYEFSYTSLHIFIFFFWICHITSQNFDWFLPCQSSKFSTFHLHIDI